MADRLYGALSHFFALYGYGVVFLGVMLENAGLPVPGETVLLFAGFLAFHGRLRLASVIATAIAGATLGDNCGYLLGYWGGTALLNRYRGRLVSAERFDRTRAALARYGHWGVFAARFIAGLRVLAGPFAGAFRMPYPRFLLANFAGAVAWALTIGWVGFLFGSNWGRLVHLVGKLDWAILAAVLAALTVLVYLRRRGPRR